MVLKSSHTTPHSKEAKERQRMVGIVASAKMMETAVVVVHTTKRHPKYKKVYRVSQRYKAHNAGNKYKEGQRVVIEATRPLSRQKRWRILGMVGKDVAKPSS